MPASAFNITVEKVGKAYVLHNHGYIAGDRLYRGNKLPQKGDKSTVLWPFKDHEVWNTHATKKAADTAAEKLQTYLLKRDKAINSDHYPNKS